MMLRWCVLVSLTANAQIYFNFMEEYIYKEIIK
jgi:hypothetical protein